MICSLKERRHKKLAYYFIIGIIRLQENVLISLLSYLYQIELVEHLLI
jgi:hypothetical protein